MRSMSVRFRLVEPLVMRGPGEISPGSWISHLSLPLPSTIAGSLAYLGWMSDPTCSECPDRFRAQISCISRIFGDVKAIRGPLLATSGSSLQIYCPVKDGFLRIEADLISRWVNLQDEGLRPGKRTIVGPEFDEILDKKLVKKSRRTGINLEVRESGKKVVKEGGLYELPYALLEKSEIVVDLLGDLNGSRPRKAVVKLGGEGRVSIAEFDQENTIYNWLKNKWGERDGGHGVLLLTSPLVIERCNSSDNVVSCFVDSVRRSLEGVAEIHENVYSPHPRSRARVGVLQLGFDERRGIKGEMRPCMFPGAVFKAEISDWWAAYEKGAGLYNEVGFGTLLPLPMGAGRSHR